MPANPLRPTTAHGQVDASELVRQAREVERGGRRRVGGGMGLRDGAAGVIITNERPEKIWIIIKSVNGGSGAGSGGVGCAKYDWTQIVFTSRCTYVELAEAMKGTVDSLPAIEVNANPNVPPGTIVEATVSTAQDCVLFEYCCGDVTGSGSGSGGGNVLELTQDYCDAYGEHKTKRYTIVFPLGTTVTVTEG